jgi:hypothetical protein
MKGPSRARRYRRLIPFAVGILALQGVVWTASGASADSGTTTAPAGFGASIENVYTQELATAQALGQTGGFETQAQFNSQVTALSSTSLAEIYTVTQQVPEWNQIPTLMQTIAADVPPTATQSSFRVATKASDGRGPKVTNAILTGDILTGFNGTTEVSPFVPQSCPTAPPEAAIFAAQIVIDVANSAYNAFVALGSISALASDFAAIAAGAIIGGVVLLVAQIVHDTLVYLQALANDCAAANLAGQVGNIDNTTVATYGVVASMMGLIETSQTTENTTEQDVLNLQTGLTTVQQTLVQALTSSTQTLQVTTGSDNQGSQTELQTIQSALQNDVTTIENLETSNGQQVVSGDTKIQTTISTNLSQIINETDTDAQGLTTLITQGNQQVINALQANFSTSQAQYEATLQIEIEQGLAGWGPVVPEVELMLPVSKGGLLNATPVGVQEVVTSDIAGLQKQGVAIKAAAVTDLSQANAALAAGQWTVAWTDYELAYQASA